MTTLPSKNNANQTTHAAKAQAESRAENSASNLELGLVNAWQKQAWWLWLLWPFSGLYGAVTYLRRKLYQTGVLSSYKAPVPVLVVGNITVGGSGKTPLIIALVNYLKQQGIIVAVISRGYGGDESAMPQVVTVDSKPSEVGDEPCLIVRETQAVVAVCPNRQQAIASIMQYQPATELIIADDGLQHYKLQRDLEWIVVDCARGFGNKQLLPTGFLREPIRRLRQGTVIHHQSPTKFNADSAPSAEPKLTMHLQPGKLTPLLAHQAAINPATVSQVYAVSGIGYPQRFFNTLSALGYEVIEKPMPDHHQFTAQDLASLTEYPVVITSKDAVKIAPLVASSPELQQLSIWVLPVQAVLSQPCYRTLMSQLASLGINR